MALFGWFKKQDSQIPVYSVMNDDHVRLYQLLGEMRQILGTDAKDDADRKARSKLILGLLERLIRECSEHFVREEALMTLYGFPEAAEHRHHHAMLGQQIRTFHANLASGRLPVTREIGDYVRTWLTGHIRTQDRDLERFLFEVGKHRNQLAQMTGNAEELARFNSLVTRLKHDRRDEAPRSGR